MGRVGFYNNSLLKEKTGFIQSLLSQIILLVSGSKKCWNTAMQVQKRWMKLLIL